MRFDAPMTPSPAGPENPFGASSETPVLCYVTDRKALGAPAQAPRGTIAAAVGAGVDWVQIREKDLPGRELLELVRGAVALADQLPRVPRPRVLVNDRLDVALAAGAAGVHLGGESLPAGEVVRWCRSGNAPPHFLVGVSCHSLAQAREAESAGASYIFFGPIFDTPSKREFGPPQGIPALVEVCRAIKLPVIAIGGVSASNGAECIRAGAAGIAAIRLFQEQRHAEALRRVVEQLHGCG